MRERGGRVERPSTSDCVRAARGGAGIHRGERPSDCILESPLTQHTLQEIDASTAEGREVRVVGGGGGFWGELVVLGRGWGAPIGGREGTWGGSLTCCKCARIERGDDEGYSVMIYKKGI
jgi:hypothetical protein